jgi:hypothetical protein
MAAARWEEHRENHSKTLHSNMLDCHKTLHSNMLDCHMLILIKQVNKFAVVTVFKEPSQRLQKHSLDRIPS